jgi:predicted amidohydrolase
MSPSSFRVAAISVDNRPGDLAGNLSRIEAWCARAGDQGVQLALFPELSLCGFVPNHPLGDHAAWLRQSLAEVRRMAQSLDGGLVQDLIGVAARRAMLVSAGMFEDAGNLLYNTQLLVGPDGLVGKWRKMHVPMFEMPFYNGGDAPQVVETPIGRVGANICFDTFLPESTRLLAVQNAELVLFPFAADPPPRTPRGWAAWAQPALQSRCAENGVFGVAANYVGHLRAAGVEQDFPGGGLIIGPRGDVLAEWPDDLSRPGMIIADLSRDALSAARAEPEYLFRFRRPELYGPLAR